VPFEILLQDGRSSRCRESKHSRRGDQSACIPHCKDHTQIEAGGIALAAERAGFDNVKVGYDNNADDDIDDAGDDLVVSDDFSGTTITPTYDSNGNLTFDGTYKYTYDAWNP
jgi:hypothetical protein